MPLVFGSDTPIEKLSPLDGIHAAVNRALPDDPRGPWTRAERLTVYETVEAFTRTAAEVSGELRVKGSISPGKVADFTVLSEDIFAIPPARIVNVGVEMTVFNGEVVFTRT